MKYELNENQKSLLDLKINNLKTKIDFVQNEIKRLDRELKSVPKKYYANKLKTKKSYDSDLITLKQKLSELEKIREQGFLEI